MNDFAIMLIVFGTCCGTALLFLDYYRNILTCNMAVAAGGARHTYPSGASDVTPVFFVGFHIVLYPCLQFYM